MIRLHRQAKGLSLESIVVPAVLKIFAKPRAHNEAMVGIDSDVAAIEKLVDVAAKQDPVADLMVAASSVSLDVCGIQHRQCALAGDSATTAIAVGHRDPEGALP